MRWNAELRTWLPLDPPSDFPKVVAEIAVPSIQASVADSEIRIQISDSVRVQRECPVNYIVLSEGQEVFTEAIMIPSGGGTFPVTYFRSQERGLSILDEIDLSLEIAGHDSPCVISIPPGVPDELQPNFNRLEFSTREDGCPILRFHRDTSIETDIGFKPHYDVELTSESANKEVEAYLGLRDCDLELTSGRLVPDVNLESPTEHYTLDLCGITSTASGSLGLRAWVVSDDEGPEHHSYEARMVVHGVPQSTGLLHLEVEYNKEDPKEKPFPISKMHLIPKDTQYVILDIPGRPHGYHGKISSASLVKKGPDNSKKAALIIQEYNLEDSATPNQGVVHVPELGKVRWEMIEAQYSDIGKAVITEMMGPPFDSLYEADSSALVLQRYVPSIQHESFLPYHPNDYQ